MTKRTSDTIWGFSDPEFSFMSNFHPAPLVFEGVQYPTVEHAYQAAKTLSPVERLSVAELPTPGGAKRAGRKLDLRDDWDVVKVQTMHQLVILKFASSQRLAKLLLDTGDTEIVEANTWDDTFWGVCNGTGQNMLGKILMQVRSQLRLTEVNSHPSD